MGAGLVVFAVIAELIIAWVEPPYRSFLTDSAIADAVIALGITIEVMLGTMWNNHIQTELRKRSNDRLQDAVDRAAKLEKEAADARGRVADIERVTSWRKISLNKPSKSLDHLPLL